MLTISPTRRLSPVSAPTNANGLAIVSHYRFDPSSPADAGLLTIDGVFFSYVPTQRGWGLLEASTGRVVNIDGRLVLRACSCREYIEPRCSRREGPQFGTCRHMLAIVKAQRTFTVCGLDTEITNKEGEE